MFLKANFQISDEHITSIPICVSLFLQVLSLQRLLSNFRDIEEKVTPLHHCKYNARGGHFASLCEISQNDLDRAGKEHRCEQTLTISIEQQF
jgi:hypothetical protein